MNITPKIITKLEPNEIFVFGSNLQGNHAGGAAYCAAAKFGAKWGQGVGLQGQSYAIPTLSFDSKEPQLELKTIGKYVSEFIEFAKSNPNLFFYVTPIGCGIAGFTEEEIAPLFKGAVGVDNIALPKAFLTILNN